MESCQKPTAGWACSRTAGHDGPCAARPTKWLTLKQRLRCVFWVLTSRNFILIHHVEEKMLPGGKGRSFKASYRTDYSDESDALTVYAAARQWVTKYAPYLLTPAKEA
jgi:hypothetical protein